MSFLSYLDKGISLLTGSENVASTAYKDSFLEDIVGGVGEFFGNEIVKGVAGAASSSIFDQKKMKLNAPSVQGKRISGARTPAGSTAGYKASAVDLGYTSKVQNAFRAAQNARVGSPVQQTVQKLATKPAKGPLLALNTGSQINVAPRAKAS